MLVSKADQAMCVWLPWLSFSRYRAAEKVACKSLKITFSSAVVPIVAMHHGSRKTDFRALYRANAVLDRIVSYWTPHIEDALKAGDPVAGTFLTCFVPFVRVVLNADVFRTWLLRRKAELRGQEWDLENARFSLSSEESHCLGFAVSAAEEMLYYLSTASRRGERAERSHAWAPRDMQTGHRPPLQLDPEVAQRLSSAVDSVLLIVYAFPPLFLAQLRAQNLLNCDLDMAPEITNDLYSVGFPSRALIPASKFMRLLELSAEFYEVTSPNKDFPAVPQAQLLRSMACLSVPQHAQPGIPGYPNRDMYSVGGVDRNAVSCKRSDTLDNRSASYALNFAQATAHAQQMRHIASTVAPTNASLPYPYNTMVFSSEGADRLDAIMQSVMPNPLSASSLLGSFAKIDADWNAFFHNTGSTMADPYGAAIGIGGLSTDRVINQLSPLSGSGAQSSSCFPGVPCQSTSNGWLEKSSGLSRIAS